MAFALAVAVVIVIVFVDFLAVFLDFSDKNLGVCKIIANFTTT